MPARSNDGPAVAELNSVAITSWLKRHAHRTFRTRLIELPSEFVSYLISDGPMFLPQTRSQQGRVSRHDSDDWSEDETEETNPIEFRDLEDRINRDIARLGGSTFVKLNWSAPRDAAWMLPGGLECRNASDVFALLKASDFAAHDLCRAYDQCRDVTTTETRLPPTLALREWRSLDSALEFRCFVLNGKLVAACQRRTDSQFEHDVSFVRRRLAEFFDDAIRSDKLLPCDIAFDVYLDSKRTYLVDINVAASFTDSLLFEWTEIRDLVSDDSMLPAPLAPTRRDAFELRITLTESCDQPTVTSSELANFRAPVDVFDIAALGGIEAIMDKCKDAERAQRSEDSDDTSSERDSENRAGKS